MDAEDDSLAIYQDNFERAYIDDMERYYKSRAPQVLFFLFVRVF